MGALGLPRPMPACLFDLDGVLTDTPWVHAAVWKEMFNSYLRREHLAGKPTPDMFLAGVAAGRAGGFGYVVEADRVGQADQFAARGVDRVVSDVADLMSHR